MSDQDRDLIIIHPPDIVARVRVQGHTLEGACHDIRFRTPGGEEVVIQLDYTAEGHVFVIPNGGNQVEVTEVPQVKVRKPAVTYLRRPKTYTPDWKALR